MEKERGELGLGYRAEYVNDMYRILYLSPHNTNIQRFTIGRHVFEPDTYQSYLPKLFYNVYIYQNIPQHLVNICTVSTYQFKDRLAVSMPTS